MRLHLAGWDEEQCQVFRRNRRTISSGCTRARVCLAIQAPEAPVSNSLIACSHDFRKDWEIKQALLRFLKGYSGTA
jgi:hypothetical protein